MPILPNTITTLPDAPVLGVDTQQTWSTKAAARLTAESAMVPELNSANTITYNNAVEAFNKATEAGNDAANALISAQNAAASSGATLWVSGTTYALGAVVYSPINGAVYRRIVAGAGTTDPSLDAVNWQPRMLNFNTGHATIKPTLNIDFANTERLDPRFTLTRNSTKTYFDAFGVMQLAQANEACFTHNPATLEPLGISIDKASTNLLLRSEEMDNAVWGKNRVSASANATTSPMGAVTAEKIIENASNGSHVVYQNATVSTNSHYTFSFFVKAAERSIVLFGFSNNSTESFSLAFNLSTKTLSGSTADGTDFKNKSSSFTELSNGWFRVSVTAQKQAVNSTIACEIHIHNGASNNYTGDGSSGLFIWGAQLEQATHATPYIPTAAATVTRQADVIADTTINDWYRQSEGTFVAEFSRVVYPVAGIDSIPTFGVSDGTVNNYMLLMSGTTSAQQRFDMFAGGALQAQINTLSVTAGANYITAAAYKTNDVAAITSGGSIVTDISATIPAVSRCYIGADAAGAVNGSQVIRRVTYYPQRLTNEQLAAMSLN